MTPTKSAPLENIYIYFFPCFVSRPYYDFGSRVRTQCKTQPAARRVHTCASTHTCTSTHKRTQLGSGGKQGLGSPSVYPFESLLANKELLMFLSLSHWRPRGAIASSARRFSQHACLRESRCHVRVLVCHSGTAGGVGGLIELRLLLNVHGTEGRAVRVAERYGQNQSIPRSSSI